MPTLRETLELVITGNASGAVSALERTGSTAQRELGRSADATNKLGGQLQVAGAAMVGFGTVALAGLGHFAAAANESELAMLKLNNSVANSPQLAGESSAAFADLANALQKKTVFDDEAIKTGEALLIQFGLTKEQVLGLTPRVADLAAKMGIDFQTASKAVGKAAEGNAGALQKMGIIVDQTAFKTDHFGAVMDALKTKAGGFAEQQGKTFSGQVEILKNQLNELEEGVGVGVVNAFSDMFGVVTGVTGALENVSPGFQAAAGEAAAFGAAALILGGAITFVGGSALKSATSLGLLTVAEEGAGGAALTTAGKLGVVGAALAGLALAYKYGSDNAEQFNITLNKSKAGRSLTAESFKTLQRELSLTGTSMEDFGRQMAEKSIPNALKLADAMDANGQSSAEFRKGIDGAKGAMKDQSAAAAEQQAAIEGTTVAEKASTEAMKSAKEASDSLTASINNQADASRSLLGANLSLRAAHDGVAESLGKLDEATRAANDGVGDQAADQKALESATTDALRAIDDQAQATVRQAENQAAATGATLSAEEKQRIYMKSLQDTANTLAPGSPLQSQLAWYVAELQNTNGTFVATLKLDLSQAQAAFDMWAAAHPGVIATPATGVIQRRATGGQVMAGHPYLIGEKGPELFVPGSSGNITPNDKMGAKAGGFHFHEGSIQIVQGPGEDAAHALPRELRALAYLSAA